MVADSTRSSEQSEPTDYYANQRKHGGRCGPESPWSRTVDSSGRRLGSVRRHEYAMHQPPEHGSCNQAAENHSGGSLHRFLLLQPPTVRGENASERCIAWACVTPVQALRESTVAYGPPWRVDAP